MTSVDQERLTGSCPEIDFRTYGAMYLELAEKQALLIDSALSHSVSPEYYLECSDEIERARQKLISAYPEHEAGRLAIVGLDAQVND
ncbi:MAG: hypothetical protein ACREBW_04785 [Candidatus Micrarchaeaceae archaeon]